MKHVIFLILYSAFFLYSLDLQAQWVRQYPMAKLEDVLDMDVSSDGYGFAVGSNDLLLRTLAGNNQWELLPGFGEGWRFETVDYLEGSGGAIAAAGGDGLIITLDKGDHWHEMPAPVGIQNIKLFSPSHMIIETSSALYVLENKVWKNLNVPVTQLNGSFILSDQVMWTIESQSAPAKIFYTTNGGLNWSSNQDIQRVDLIRFFDALNGIALDGRNVYGTTNGGQNWNLISSNQLKNSAYDLSFGSSSNVLIAATYNAKPNISIDGGLTWVDITTTHISQRSFSVAAVSDTEFWLGNDISSILHSTDGGVTWEEASGPKRNLIQDIYFVNRQTGFAIGQKGMLLRTQDGGAHWEDISFGIRSYLCIQGLDANNLWIGTNQRILHSIDNGSNWTEAGVFPNGNINDILAISTERILATSTTGTIYLSKNGGMSWDSVYSSGLQMRSLAKIDDQHFMATGFNGVIVRSDDQGQSWHPVTIPEPGLQYEQSFFLNGEGWLISSSFKKSMWHTTNAGDSWDTLALPIDRFWDGVYFITPDTGIIVGRTSAEGRAYITFDGGHHWQSGNILSHPLFGVTGVPNPNGTAWIYGFGSDIQNLPYCNAFPVISDFMGDLFPCEQATVEYTLYSQDVDQFTWHFPSGWQILGEANNDSLQVIAGPTSGVITVSGSNICGVTGQLSYSTGPIRLPAITDFIGDLSPCAGDIITYSVNAAGVDQFIWSFPPGWEIIGADNTATIHVYVGSDPGTISVNGTNPCGTSELSFDLHPFTIPEVNVIVNALSLSLSANASTYQWYLNEVAIPGATDATYEVTVSGYYFAELVFPPGCTTTSDTVDVIISGVKNGSAGLPIDVFPVPASDEIFIRGIYGDFNYSVMDLLGKNVSQNYSSTNSIPTGTLPEGLYVLKVEQGGNIYLAKFIVNRR